MTTINAKQAQALKALVDAGFSFEEAAVMYKALVGEQPKAESKATTTAKPKPNAENGKALMLNCKFNIEKTVRTDDPSVAVWRVSLAERVAKPDWADLSRYFGAEFDAGYWRGAWTFSFDPTNVLAGGKMTAKQSKALEDRKAERKAAREAKKAAKRA